jgi:hypothetical protein
VSQGGSQPLGEFLRANFYREVWVRESRTAGLSRHHRRCRSNAPGPIPHRRHSSANFHAIVRESDDRDRSTHDKGGDTPEAETKPDWSEVMEEGSLPPIAPPWFADMQEGDLYIIVHM